MKINKKGISNVLEYNTQVAEILDLYKTRMVIIQGDLKFKVIDDLVEQYGIGIGNDRENVFEKFQV